MLEISFIIMTIWDTLIDPFVFMAEEIIMNPMLIGAIIFIFFTMFGLLMFIPIEVMVVIWIPLSLLIAIWIPALQIVVALMFGLLVGLGLLKWVRR
mgnify:CR=1 FL=1